VRQLGMKRILAYTFALACLVWVFHDIHGREVLVVMSTTKWQFVALGIAIDILTYVLQGVRWKLLLAPVGQLSCLRTTQAIYAGLFTNELVPLRFGEFVRAFLVSQWLSTRFTMVLPSMVVERFLDALWLSAGIGVAAMVFPLPKKFIEAGYALGGIVLLTAAFLLWLVYRSAKAPRQDAWNSRSRIVSGVLRVASQFASGLRDIGASYRVVLAALLSAGMLGCQALALWFILLGCHLDLPLWVGTIVLLIVRVGTAIPNAPANLGSSQFFTVLALRFFEVKKTIAVGFSITYFLALTIPLWIIGLLAITSAGVKISNIRSAVEVSAYDAD
jgi:uncharacterized protein (TIRG00374 family)